jgi:hypothetical protein
MSFADFATESASDFLGSTMVPGWSRVLISASASAVGLTPSPTCFPNKEVTVWDVASATKRVMRKSALLSNRLRVFHVEGLFMSKRNEVAEEILQNIVE